MESCSIISYLYSLHLYLLTIWQMANNLLYNTLSGREEKSFSFTFIVSFSTFLLSSLTVSSPIWSFIPILGGVIIFQNGWMDGRMDGRTRGITIKNSFPNWTLLYFSFKCTESRNKTSNFDLFIICEIEML